jgi:glycosyltransferase involved in cell wall biosynthesis
MMGKKKFIELIEKEKPDIVLTTAYPVSAFFFGRLLKKKYPEIKWIADYRDLWSEHQWYERPWPFNKFEQVLEKFTLKKADEIITTSKEFQEKLQLLHQRESIPVIYNGYDEDINDKPYESDKFIISYTGVLYEQQRPDIFLEAIKNLIVASKIDKELLQIDFYGKMPDYLEALVGQYGLTTLVNLHGVIPRAEVIQKQRQSNLLLLIRWDKGPLHVKVFEYLSARIPVLAMVSRKSEIADLVESSLCGEVCTAGNEVADYVFSYYDYWKTEKSNRLVKISPECEFFSRGNQAARLFKELQKFSK